MAKDLTAVRLRPEQIDGLNKIAAKDKELTVSILIRRAVDQFLERERRKKGK
jgi:predicted transcriptional regulator